MTTVSVIIPNYNHARFLEMRIGSVLAQTFQDFELILLDDCSTDDSRRVLEGYRNHPRVSQVLYNEQNSGSPFRQWRKGIEAARGEYIWIAESDDYADPVLLERLVAQFAGNARLNVAYCQSWYVNAEGRVVGAWAFPGRSNAFLNDFVEEGTVFVQHYMSIVNAIPNASAVVFRKTAYLQTPPADATFRLTGDWLTWINLLRTGQVAYVALPLNYFRTHTHNVRLTSEKSGLYLTETSRIMQYIAGSTRPSPEMVSRMIWYFLDLWLLHLRRHNLPFAVSVHVYRRLKSIDGGINRRILKKIARSPGQVLGVLPGLLKSAVPGRGNANHSA